LYSILNIFFILFSPFSSVLIGRLSDHYESSVTNIKAIFCAASFFLTVPFTVVMYLTESFEVAMICLGISSLVAEAYIGVSYSVMINLTRPRLKAFQTAWMMSVTMVLGAAAVLVVGVFYDQLNDLRIALVASAVVSLISAGFCFVWVSFVYRKDLQEFQRKENNEVPLNDSVER
jgi:MFS family permease